ncbi:MAG: lipoate--protein ligase family protein [Candidatus Thermoplasmatota archaeon]|nr:lipoate--protein ligase family protein [Euryarchaeota archaeon]MBU4031892.1 lipoate--protein ligase family protein [Candidatus Thermoplasmatota archaeon]MBU4071146.1 lipoate--protein ligase family protein [Candidatus Thermoplasmatota archaeon]MBU4143763.1 lipoate--protein ligase family protein [Candidatus Thermoplasmatota archaeon]MBU4591403.1 lipoate--protein ligase family protein [Candidatus Thermoplasmatota archaeon]
MNWRLVDSDLSEPAYTVAADEAMALARSRDEVPNTLHFYRRSCPTVSLGYFQKVSDAVDMDFCRKNGIRIVRRVTGGSTIYTDEHHLIYGLALNVASIPSKRDDAFRTVCSAIVHALDELGIQSVFKPVNDILVNGRKISGSAQMRRWGIVLQHGTLILRNRPGMMLGALKMDVDKIHSRGREPADYVTSLEEVLGKEPDVQKVKDALVRGFESVFDIRFNKDAFSESENRDIQNLIETRYGLENWTMRRP